MRVLFVSSYNLPEEMQARPNGPRKRWHMFLDAFKDIGEIDLLSFVAPNTDISKAENSKREYELSKQLNIKVNLFLCHLELHSQFSSKWHKHSASVFSFLRGYPYTAVAGSSQVNAFETCLACKPDVIFVQRLASMPPLMLTQKSLPPVIFDLDDIEHIRFFRQLCQSRNIFKVLRLLQFPALFLGERQAIQMAQKTFVCSEVDRNYLTNRLGLKNIEIIPNAVSIPKHQPLTTEPTLLTLGSYYSGANVEGANFLIERVWPLIYTKMPEAKLIIAGEAPQNIRSYGKDTPRVEFSGFVEDLDALYRRSRVVCCSIFMGAGTRVKLVEAAGYQKPIVATRIGVEGLDFEDGREFLLRNKPEEFAQACIELLRNDSLCETLGAAAREAAIRSYERNNIIPLIQKHIIQSTDTLQNELMN